MKTSTFKKIAYENVFLVGKHTIPCWMCKKELIKTKATVDHVMPKSKGGSCCATNFRIACKTCNLRKGNTIMSRKMKPKLNWNGKTGYYFN